MSKSNYVLAEEPAVDLAMLAAEAAELETYIVKGETYHAVRVNLPGGDRMLQMSGGDLLARLFRLNGVAAQLTAGQRAELDQVRGEIERSIYSLRTRFHAMLNRELKVRLDSLNWYLDEVAADPQQARGEYPYEIRNRQRADAILRELGSAAEPELKKLLSRVDERIRLVVARTGFVWDAKLEPIFPREEFWYLYVAP